MSKGNRVLLFLVLWCICIIVYFASGRNALAVFLFPLLLGVKMLLDYRDRAK